MTAFDPSFAASYDCVDRDAADGSLVSDILDSGTSTGVTATTLTDSGKAWGSNVWNGAVVTSGGSTATVTSNDGTVLTFTGGWTGGTPATGAYIVDIGLADDDTTTQVVKQGKSPDDIAKVHFPVDPLGLSTSDTISVHFGMTMNYVEMAILPYDAAGTVDPTNRIAYTLSGGSPAVFTLTQNFIDDLFDQGGGSFDNYP